MHSTILALLPFLLSLSADPLSVGPLRADPVPGVPASAAVDRQPSDPHAALARDLGLVDFELQPLELREEGAGLRVELVLDGRPVQLQLAPVEHRAADFQLWTMDGPERLVPRAALPPRTFRGSLVGEPGRRAAGGLVEGGLSALILAGDGRAHYVEPLQRHVPGAAPGLHIVHSSDELDLPADFCGTDLLPAVPPAGTGGGDVYGGEPGCFRISELGFDLDHEYYLASGADVNQTLANLDAIMAACNLIYAHEVQIEHVLSNVVVRDQEPDPYSSFVPGELLDALRATWNGPLSGLERDHVHLGTGREMDGNIIGLAYVGVVCNFSFGHGLTQFNLGFGGIVGVLAHELGHNWAAPHCLDSICGIMCGICVQEFGPVTTDTILAHRDSRTCLDTTDGYGLPVAPEAQRDSAEGSIQVLIDVLANDLDGNCDTVVIEDFDATTQGGGAVFRSVGSGPGGRDELRYVPAAGFQGTDTFTYLAGDGTGLTEAGLVSVSTYDGYPDLVGHWRLDEQSGVDLVDEGPGGMSGTYLGSPLLGQPGAAAGTGTCVRFGGFADRGEVLQSSQLAGLRTSFSVAAWVHPEQVASGGARIFGNGSGWRLSLLDGRLRLTLDGVTEHTLPSALPLDSWSHVAASYRTGGEVRLYVDGQRVYTAAASGAANVPASEWYVGGGGGVTTALFPGRIDDLQVYDGELGDEGVSAIHAAPGTVYLPCKPAESFCEPNVNSTGLGAQIGVGGQPSLTGPDLQLIAGVVPANQFGVFFYGPSPLLQPFGEGVLCVGGSVTRLAPVSADSLGQASASFDLDQPLLGIQVGDRLLMQYWYRDPLGGPGGFNLSDAVAIEVCP